MASLQEATDDRLVDGYVALRDRRALRKAEFENADEGDKQKQAKIEAEFLRRFHERGSDSTKTAFGTAYTKTTVRASVADWDAFFTGYVLPNQAWGFLEQRANKTAVTDFRKEHDSLPPGINWSEELSVGVRRSNTTHQE